MSDMWYLDTAEAKPIFEKQADIIIENKYKGIVDVGCRHGPVNDILQEKNYQFYDYYGFDTSPEPIKIAQHQWSHKPNIDYKVGDWNKLEKFFDNYYNDTKFHFEAIQKAYNRAMEIYSYKSIHNRFIKMLN